jgi:catechol 2,3-dioxygenase-like lactoylglutathione lyase family enzyme
LVAFVPTTDVARALTFYRDVLGLRLIEETPFALVFDAAGNALRVTPVPKMRPATHTVVGAINHATGRRSVNIQR